MNSNTHLPVQLFISEEQLGFNETQQSQAEVISDTLRVIDFAFSWEMERNESRELFLAIGFAGRTFDEFKKFAEEAIDSGRCSDQSISEWKFSLLQHCIFEPDIFPLFLSCAFSIQASKANNCSYTELAWSLIAKAQHYLGQHEAVEKVEAYKSFTTQKSKTARNNGSKRERSYLEVKRYAVKLLEERAPKEGWKNKTAAIAGIETELYYFIKSNEIDLIPSDLNDTEALPKWLNKWIGLDLAMTDAFEKNKAKKIASANQ